MNRDDAPLPSREDLRWGWCFGLLVIVCMTAGMFTALAWLAPACRDVPGAPHADISPEVVEPLCISLGAFVGVLCAATIARWLQRHRVPAATRRRWRLQFDAMHAQAAPLMKPVMRALHRLLFVPD